MTDQSFLDEKYFVSTRIYNCPFCNRRHVRYIVIAKYDFDWTKSKKCFSYIVKCASCGNSSMHLSYHDIRVIRSKDAIGVINEIFYLEGELEDKELDDLFFYSVPTSFFVLDNRIQKILRELMTEAEGCLKSNFLTGASACARKIIYELAHHHDITDGNYDDRIKSLKSQNPDIDGTYFDTLLTIQKATSSMVHENAYDGWDAKHVRLILSALREILHELYVAPALLEDRRKGILALRQEVLGDGSAPAAEDPDTADA